MKNICFAIMCIVTIAALITVMLFNGDTITVRATVITMVIEYIVFIPCFILFIKKSTQGGNPRAQK